MLNKMKAIYILLKFNLPKEESVIKLIEDYIHINFQKCEDKNAYIETFSNRFGIVRCNILLGNVPCTTTALLHELGHYEDYLVNPVQRYLPNLSRKEREANAWRQAIVLTRKYKLEHLFNIELANESIKSYGLNFQLEKLG